MHLDLKSGRTESEPVLALAIQQQALACRGEILEPLQRLPVGPIAHRNRNIHTLTVPVELRRQEDDFGLVGTKPFGQGAGWQDPAAMEALAGIQRPPLVDQATVAGTVGTGV